MTSRNTVSRLVGDGALRFARYALPPNRLGYCGPGDDLALFEQAVALSEARPPPASPLNPDLLDAGEVVPGLRSLARGFEGAWPYLELIAGANGIVDPLDDRVVAAYWLGGQRLKAVGAFATGNHMEQRFAARAGRWWGQVGAALEPGASPSHAFHVMVVGPWVGMLRGGHVETPIEVMDHCRVRRGLVLGVAADEAVVRTDRVCFRHGQLQVGDPAGKAEVQTVRLGIGGQHPCGPVAVGDTVAIHWDWVCEVLDGQAAATLARTEHEAIERANRALAIPGSPEPG